MARRSSRTAWLEGLDKKLKKTLRAPLIHDLDTLPQIPYELFPRVHRLRDFQNKTN